ncbi:energy-coupling factor transporter transmembrane component T family protein [Candidatus Phytoplasma oryzae]|nr:energy-coupling factor transporter transmembrane component T [Candidatus Phytoplasma oryzae]
MFKLTDRNSNLKSKSFLFTINPALKIIFTFLIFKIIFTLDIDFFLKKEKNKIDILFFCLPLFFITITLFYLLFSINFSFSKLIENVSHFKFFIFFSFLIHLSLQKKSEQYLKIYIFKNTFFWFFMFFLFFLFFIKQKKTKNIYILFNLFIFIMLPFVCFINNFKIYYIQTLFLEIKDLLNIFLILIRILLILILNILISETTSFMEISDGIEIILKPLKKIGVPVEIFAIMLSLIFMSIPFLLYEIQKIIKAQISRGLNLYTKNIFKKIYFLIALLIPIFILIFKKSFVLSNAMETRGFILGKPRTKLSHYYINKKDFFILFIVLFFFIFSFFY